MKEKIEKAQKSNFILLILLFMTLMLFLDSKLIIKSTINVIEVFMYNVLPSLFPFFVLSDLLANYNFVFYLNKLLNKPFHFLFHMSGNGSFVLLMSMISGFPSGAKYTKKLLDEKYIDQDTANYLITFTHFSNPLFVFGTILLFLTDMKLTTLIYICHIFSNFIIALIIRPKKKDIKKIVSTKRTPEPFISTLTNSIYSTFKILLLIIGNAIFVNMITSIIINNISLPPLLDSIVYGLFDMTMGISTASKLSLLPQIKSILMLTFISFGGISVHLQVSSLIANTKIKYRNFLLGRICQIGISIMLFMLFYNLFF